ncbi:MAG: response regulator [Dechloromonas sp.]|jgi:DNA-binding response OmpR family regulator|uniref:Response regulator n=1 Tax=Candidatus Dechloromonas phosphorivorans TaxID=2899244 RepID=A0A935MZ53_9RHOO|nr:response regulator [Candidatus Dechloromonas phosphorivorans]
MGDYSKKRFLVVDDQPMAREALRSIALTVGAFAVEFASSYQDALYRIRNNVPDIILSDYMLGDGRSGQQLLEELRRFNMLPDETIFMMVTGEQAYEQVVSAVELVPDDYIIKPFSPDKLVLRLDRITAKKNFFAGFYREKRKQDFAAAIAFLQAQHDTEAGRPYRFEILRQQAETQLAIGDLKAAEATYRNILDKYEFPWARAGMARTMHRQSRLVEARQEIERVVASTPHFFDAADLKATICMAQGEHAEAQRVLDEVAKRTPRNYLRKRLLAEAATLNGDTETARAAMTDVITNDTMPGAIAPEDRLALARSHINSGDNISAEKILLSLRDGEVRSLNLPEQASYAALMALASPERGTSRFSGLRPAMLASKLTPTAQMDIVRAALSVKDHKLADLHTDYLMSSLDAKKVFSNIRAQYALHGREQDFRTIQKEVALRRIQQEAAAQSASTMIDF